MKKVIKYGIIAIAALVVLGLVVSKSDQGAAAPGAEKLKVLAVNNEIGEAGMYICHITMVNTTGKLLEAASVKALLYNEAGTLIGTAPGSLLNLPAGDTAVVDCITMNVQGAHTVKTQIEATIWK